MTRKGNYRDTSGTKNPTAKLTEADVREIIELLRTDASVLSIARLKGVSPNAIERINDGRGWRHIPRK